MHRYPQADIVRFLEEVDRHLTAPHSIVVIGGAAASLAYKASRTTADIDTASPIPQEIVETAGQATKTTGLRIPIGFAGVFDAPYNYEKRLVHLEALRLEKLAVLVPERHDLALMKIVRGEEHDIQVLIEMHEQRPFKLEMLVDRFVREMTHVTGRLEAIRTNMLGLVDEIFGAETATDVERRTEDWAAMAQNHEIQEC